MSAGSTYHSAQPLHVQSLWLCQGHKKMNLDGEAQGLIIKGVVLEMLAVGVLRCTIVCKAEKFFLLRSNLVQFWDKISIRS